MHQNRRKQAQAIAIAKAQDELVRKFALVALAITMTAACAYGFMTLAF